MVWFTDSRLQFNRISIFLNDINFNYMSVKCIVGEQQRYIETEKNTYRYILFQCALYRTSYQRGNFKLIYSSEMSTGD